MTIYSGPSKEVEGSYHAKFVRVEDKLVTTEPNDGTAHNLLAQKDGIFGQLEQVRRRNQDEVDAGTYSVVGQTIILRGSSQTLSLPRTQKARERTAEVFRAQSEGYEVEVEQ